jgi:hypothetical protein
LLLAASDRLSSNGLVPLTRVLGSNDPSNEIGATQGVKDLLRQLLAAHDARHRLCRFNEAIAAGGLGGGHQQLTAHRFALPPGVQAACRPWTRIWPR